MAVVQETPWRLVLRVADDAAAHRVVPGEPVADDGTPTADPTLSVDRAGHPDPVVYSAVAPSGDSIRRAYGVGHWGATEVARPAGAGSSLVVLVLDVLDHDRRGGN